MSTGDLALIIAIISLSLSLTGTSVPTIAAWIERKRTQAIMRRVEATIKSNWKWNRDQQCFDRNIKDG